MDFDIAVDNGSLRVRSSAKEALLPEIEPGPGWYGSSRALLQGLDVVECHGVQADPSKESVDTSGATPALGS